MPHRTQGKTSSESKTTACEMDVSKPRRREGARWQASRGMGGFLGRSDGPYMSRKSEVASTPGQRNLATV